MKRPLLFCGRNKTAFTTCYRNKMHFIIYFLYNIEMSSVFCYCNRISFITCYLYEMTLAVCYCIKLLLFSLIVIKWPLLFTFHLLFIFLIISKLNQEYRNKSISQEKVVPFEQSHLPSFQPSKYKQSGREERTSRNSSTMKIDLSYFHSGVSE